MGLIRQSFIIIMKSLWICCFMKILWTYESRFNVLYKIFEIICMGLMMGTIRMFLCWSIIDSILLRSGECSSSPVSIKYQNLIMHKGFFVIDCLCICIKRVLSMFCVRLCRFAFFIFIMVTIIIIVNKVMLLFMWFQYILIILILIYFIYFYLFCS